MGDFDRSLIPVSFSTLLSFCSLTYLFPLLYIIYISSRPISFSPRNPRSQGEKGWQTGRKPTTGLAWLDRNHVRLACTSFHPHDASASAALFSHHHHQCCQQGQQKQNQCLESVRRRHRQDKVSRRAPQNSAGCGKGDRPIVREQMAAGF